MHPSSKCHERYNSPPQSPGARCFAAQSVGAIPHSQPETYMKSLSRREFSRLVTGAAAATAVAPLGLLNARMALAQSCSLASFAVPGFGPISPVLPNNTSELGDVPTQGNLVGVPLIALPALF